METSGLQRLTLSKTGVVYDVSLPMKVMFDLAVDLAVDLIKTDESKIDEILDAEFNLDEELVIEFRVQVDDVRHETFMLFEGDMRPLYFNLFVKALLLPHYEDKYGGDMKS